MRQDNLPLIAILRGITLPEIEPVSRALFDAGVRYIEIPLNSPDPFTSIEALTAYIGDEAICGAGTVMTVTDIERVASCGGKLIVSPHTNVKLIAAALARELLVFPGVATATEAITAVDAGATHLKLFPAGDLGAGYLKSIRVVLPADVHVYAVGGIGLDDLGAFWNSGAKGFGIGSGVYRPGMAASQVFELATQYVRAVESLI
ncbi:MAG: 2-dehydro-3-deoxyphosphogalactonate aldolase [Candidatus Azotimanducaceae bacterium]|jgi:2-dehydro-3-deoxyphosphogalactonate aldolase